MWKKWKEEWKEKWQNKKSPLKNPGFRLNLLPAILVFAAAAAAVVRYQPVSGEERGLSKLFEQYENQVEASLLAATTAQPEESTAAKKAETFKDGTYEGTGTGFGGQIKVQVTVKDTKITSIDILSAPGEDSSFLQKAKAIIDRIIEAQNLEVDTISGATYSSRGILSAVKNALYGTEDTNTTAKTESKKAGATPTVDVPEAGYEDGVYEGTGTGFGGKITVEVTIKKGKIKKVKILEASGETPSYLKKAKSLLKTIVKKQTPNVQAVSGATFSSNGIIKAVQNALKKAEKKSGKKDDDKENQKEKKKDNNKKKEENTDNGKADDAAYKDGIYTGTGKGYKGNITVKVTIKDGKITAIEVTDGGKDDKAFLDKAKAIIDVMLEKQTADVDTATGATYSSKGIISAVKDALSKAAGKEKEDSAENNTNTAEEGKTDSATNEENTTQNETNTENSENTTENTSVKEPDKTEPSDSTNAQETTTEEAKGRYKDGTYTGKGMGYYDNITATVTVQGGKITAVQFSTPFGGDDEEESEWLYKIENELASKIIANQSADGIDTISGATYSTRGAVKAVKNALKEAEN